MSPHHASSGNLSCNACASFKTSPTAFSIASSLHSATAATCALGVCGAGDDDDMCDTGQCQGILLPQKTHLNKQQSVLFLENLKYYLRMRNARLNVQQTDAGDVLF